MVIINPIFMSKLSKIFPEISDQKIEILTFFVYGMSTKDIAYCSCPLISRQGLYLKLTLPADVDILAESDNPTHYADGFHCNARSPLQGYAMPFLHSVSA